MTEFSGLIRRAGVVALGVSATLFATAALAGGVSVSIDQVTMVKFAKPVATVFVANPMIADITIVDQSKIFVLGKNFGTTNLIALDKDGNQLYEDQISVT